MDFQPIPPRFPLPAYLVVLLCGVFLLAGSLGHDPWKADDAIQLGIVSGLMRGDEDWLPRIGGIPLAGVISLFHWLAWLTATLTQSILPFADGARLASVLCVALALWCVWRAATLLYGRETAFVAPLLCISTVGLLLPLHDAQPALLTLALGCLAYLGLTLIPQQPQGGAVVLGMGLGAALFSGALSGGAPLLFLLLAPLLQKRFLATLWALAAMLLIVGLWALLLYVQSPALVSRWFDYELAGLTKPVYFGSVRTSLELLAWYVWPLWPLAAWTLWQQRRRLATWPLQAPLVGLCGALLWFFCAEARPLPVFALVPPLVLLAADGAGKLRRGAANGFDWFSISTFSLCLLIVWLGAIALWTGWPVSLAHNMQRLTPGYTLSFSLAPFLIALLASLAWLAVLRFLPKSPWRSSVRWSTGLTLLWVMLMTLWLPWIDYGKSYRPVVDSLVKTLRAQRAKGCMADSGLGLAQRAVLDIHGGIRSLPGVSRCNWLLVQADVAEDERIAGWKLLWQGHRAADHSEVLRLYRKI